jgi:ribonuclease P protein component
MWGRLRKGREFRAVFDGGSSVANALAALYVLPSDRGETRVGIAAGRRLGGAVARNRHRRRWREVLRRNAAALPAGVDLVLVSRARAASAPFAELERALLDLLGRLRREVAR